MVQMRFIECPLWAKYCVKKGHFVFVTLHEADPIPMSVEETGPESRDFLKVTGSVLVACGSPC